MVNSRLCLIDANSLFYRAFFAIKAQLVTSSGQPTNAVFGFVKMVNKVLEDLKPDYIAVCFDVAKKTHRNEKFADYKINRAAMPQELVSQVPLIKAVVEAHHFSQFQAQGFEADDVIASIVHQAAKKVAKIVIVSSDKDILQLVSDSVEVYNPYKDDGIVFTRDVVEKKFGVSPEKICDLIALMGDASDNIPGAKGIGEKTARQLLADFEDVEDLIKHVARIKRDKLRKIVEDSHEAIMLSKDLATLRHDVPLEVNLPDLKRRDPDIEALWQLYSRLEFKGMLKNLADKRLSAGSGLKFEIPKKDIVDFSKVIARIQQEGVFSFYVNEEEFKHGSLKVNIAFDDRGVYEVGPESLEHLFSCAEWIAVGHDVKRARHILRSYGIQTKVKFFDTMIAAYLLESSKTAVLLENLLWDHLSLKGVSRLDYLGKESHFVFKLYAVLTKSLQEKNLFSLFEDVEMPLADILFDMEVTGVKIDAAFLGDLSQDLDKRLQKLIASIYDLAGSPFNINSPKQLAEILFHRLKLPPVKRIKTGFSTNEEVLTKLSIDHELPKFLLEYRQISKLKTTYVDALPGLVDAKTGKIHTCFNQTVTETGRLSSSNPNLQNIPIKTDLGASIRRAFIPSKGFDEVLSADYSQIELRMLAHLSGDEALSQAFKEGRDIHRYTASLIFSCDENAVSDEMRDNSKRVNFGIIYGMSPYGLAKDLKIDARTAESFISEYFARYPKVKSYLDSQIALVEKNGFVMTILGRRRYIPEINNANAALRQFAQRQAINAPVQGSAADLIKLAMISIQRQLAASGLKSRMILQIHDELVFEVKDKEKEELVGLVRHAMENAFALRVPVKVKVYIGKNWLQMEEV
ncbi:MAG: DNA polymerase I [Candidatus Omnitrophota bacterium]